MSLLRRLSDADATADLQRRLRQLSEQQLNQVL
jgi:hypothetical protein